MGGECIRFTEDTIGIQLIPWQKWFLWHALELHPTDVDEYGEPVFRFRKIVLLVGRQNGKSTVMQALTLWRLFVDRCSLVIGTAQDLEIAETLWSEALDMALDVEELRNEIESGGKIERQPGRKMFRLRTRETYKVKAANRRGGRGLSGELVLLDELREHQSWDAWAAVTKTTNARARAQIYGVSNAGDATSVVLRYLRKTAHAALGDPDGLNARESPEELIDEALLDEDQDIDSGLGLFEWSAAPGSDRRDPEALAQSNPSLGYTGMRLGTLLSDAATDPEWVFRTECMCQWTDGVLEGPFPPGAWDAGRWQPPKDDPDARPPQIVGTVRAGVSVAQDRSRASIAFAGMNERGRAQVEIVASRAGVEWVAGWLRARVDSGVVVEVGGQSNGAPVSPLLDELATAGFPVVPIAGGDLTAATARTYDAVRDNLIDHLPQPVLDVAAATAVPKLTSSGAFLWDDRKSPTDIHTLQAFTAAYGLLSRPVEDQTSVYEERGFIVLDL